ncbi:hypothetical protein JCM5350_000091 [Sporobolomyces pararoseus]
MDGAAHSGIDMETLTSAIDQDWKEEEIEEDDDFLPPTFGSSASTTSPSPSQGLDVNSPIWKVDIWKQIYQGQISEPIGDENRNSESKVEVENRSSKSRADQITKIRRANTHLFSPDDPIRRLASWLRTKQVILCTIYGPTRQTEVVVVFLPQDSEGRPMVTLESDLAQVELELSKVWKYSTTSTLRRILSRLHLYKQSIRGTIERLVKSALGTKDGTTPSSTRPSLPPSLVESLAHAQQTGHAIRTTRDGTPNLVDTAVALERPLFGLILNFVNSGGSANEYFSLKGSDLDDEVEYGLSIKLLPTGATVDAVERENRMMMGKGSGSAVEMLPLSGRTGVAYSEVPFSRGISKNGAFGSALLSLASFGRFPGVSVVAYSRAKTADGKWIPISGYGFFHEPRYSAKILNDSLSLLDSVLRLRMGTKVDLSKPQIALEPLPTQKTTSKFDINTLMTSHSKLVEAVQKTPILAFPTLFKTVVNRLVSNAQTKFGGKLSRKEVSLVFDELRRRMSAEDLKILVEKYGGSEEVERMVEGLEAGQAARRAERSRNHLKPITASSQSPSSSAASNPCNVSPSPSSDLSGSVHSSSTASTLNSSNFSSWNDTSSDSTTHHSTSSSSLSDSPASQLDSASCKSQIGGSLSGSAAPPVPPSSTQSIPSSSSSTQPSVPQLATDVQGPRFETPASDRASKRRRS